MELEGNQMLVLSKVLCIHWSCLQWSQIQSEYHIAGGGDAVTQIENREGGAGLKNTQVPFETS